MRFCAINVTQRRRWGDMSLFLARRPHTNHTYLMPGLYETGSQVTLRCLECHEDAAEQVMQTVH
jgi:hypothetical protein